MTTREDLASWYDEGVDDGKKFMVVVCDTFDYEDYPCFFDTLEAAKAKTSSPGSMQRIMETYDLTGDRGEQLAARRNFAF